MKTQNISLLFNKNLLIILSFIFLTSACSSSGSSRRSTSNAMPTEVAEVDEVTPSDGDEAPDTEPETEPMDDGQPNLFGETSDQPRSSTIQSGQALLLNTLSQSSNTVFGSVVQSISVGVSDPSGVDTTFDGGRFTFQIDRADGSSTKLDTDSDALYVDYVYEPHENPVTDRPAADGYVYRINNSELTAAGVLVEWSNTDHTDYLAGGYWLHVDFETGGAEIGAFIDGPAYDRPVDMPVTGMATYNGRAGGFYVSSHGTDTNLAEGTIELGEYYGNLRLVADFGAMNISGGVSNMDLFPSYAESPEGLVYSLENTTDSGYGFRFGFAPINQEGQFTGNDFTVTHPSVGIASSSGSWAGRFSTVDDSSGYPRGVAGTHKGGLTTNGGGKAAFVGMHYGTTGRFD